jgi:hypothetical protein
LEELAGWVLILAFYICAAVVFLFCIICVVIKEGRVANDGEYIFSPIDA